MDRPTAPNEKFGKKTQLSEVKGHYRLFMNADSTMLRRLQGIENIV
jgi:hypothetical protein